MKLLLFIVVMLSVVIFSCRKEEDNKPLGEYYGYCTTLKDNVLWSAKPYGIYDTIRWKKEAASIVARRFENSILKETLRFSRVPLRAGVYDMKRFVLSEEKIWTNLTAKYYIEEENGHVAGHEFLLDTLAKSNRFEVTDYNTTTGNISVRFTATFFIKDRSKAHIIDTVKFTNGEISTKVIY